MAIIDGIRRTAAGSPTAMRPRMTAGGEANDTAPGRALMVVHPAARAEPSSLSSGRTSADFLAHLIATDQQAPQTRTRRRAEPGQASLAYRATLALSVAAGPRLLHKAC